MFRSSAMDISMFVVCKSLMIKIPYCLLQCNFGVNNILYVKSVKTACSKSKKNLKFLYRIVCKAKFPIFLDMLNVSTKIFVQITHLNLSCQALEVINNMLCLELPVEQFKILTQILPANFLSKKRRIQDFRII